LSPKFHLQNKIKIKTSKTREKEALVGKKHTVGFWGAGNVSFLH
jgi:hypothetical protein